MKTSVWAESIQDFDPARIFQSPVLYLYSERRGTPVLWLCDCALSIFGCLIFESLCVFAGVSPAEASEFVLTCAQLSEDRAHLHSREKWLSGECIILPFQLQLHLPSREEKGWVISHPVMNTSNCVFLPNSLSHGDLIYFTHFDPSLLLGHHCVSLLKCFPPQAFWPQAIPPAPATLPCDVSLCGAQQDGGVLYEVQSCTLGHKYTLNAEMYS